MHKAVRTAGVALTITVAAATLAACGTSSASDAPQVVALLPQGNDQPYGATYVATLRKQAEERGIDLEITNSKYDPSRQASECDVAIAKKPDGIILWPADAASVRPCLLKAEKAGIPVTSTNSDVKADDKSLVRAYSGPSNDEVGRLDADLLNTGMGGQGNIIVIAGTSGNSTAVDRLNGFKAQLATKYPGIKILGEQPANWDKAQAITATSELVTRFGDQINGVYAQDDTMAAGVVEAMKNRGIDPASRIIVGCGNTVLGQANVLAGAQYGTLFQSPIWDGEYAINTIADVIEKKTVSDTFMPMPLVTQDNASQYPPEW
ncbi:sugar ABC transporter substrate-binding protein [Rhodococcus sp. NCIMB 12038]|uniref:sugar ABC transporter substrate-binding protein n=1 Tax=Rhodococcus sp. NCIMB 12038 TaxID=933800 RepID=UPI000B3CBE08|nr:sugar ABC transporter substrate-binding protein [Rhodococcus sp. NCIMB 12038]OUS93225.1 hypothetical protein CA951_24555 [Rhodococcus sp. NCIMB 12038]